MTLRSSDQFDDFRKERQRARARQASGPKEGHPSGYENQALKELEEVEKREVLEHRLTREVHDFFQTATRQAAGIVERVARTAQEETGARVEQEMEAFLMDALARMNAFIVAALQQKTPVAEADMEPRVARLVGQTLDDFRWEGTAEGADKHIGQDPFETDVEEVRREFRAQVPENKDPAPESVPIEQHLVAAVTDKEPEAADAPAEAPKEPAAVAEEEDVVEEPTKAAKAQAAELERFKSALKTLVKKGTMSKDEARAAWQTRLQTLTKKS